MRKAASIALGASCGSRRREAKNVSTTRLKLISPSPSATGQHQDEHALHRRVAPVEDDPQAPVEAHSHGTGSSTWITVPTRIAPA